MTEEIGRYRPRGDYKMVTTHAHLIDRMYFFGKQRERYLREKDFIKKVMREYSNGNKIIDVGCGTGIHIMMLSEAGYNVSGFDLRREMVDVAQKRNPLNRIVQGDMREFPINEKADGLICMYGAINYLENETDIERTFNNFFRHLNPRGVVIIDTRSWNNLDENINTWVTNEWILAKQWIKSNRPMESAYRVFYAIPPEGVMELEDHMQYFQDPFWLVNKLSLSGFSKINIFESYDFDKRFEQDSKSHLPVIVACKG